MTSVVIPLKRAMTSGTGPRRNKTKFTVQSAILKAMRKVRYVMNKDWQSGKNLFTKLIFGMILLRARKRPEILRTWLGHKAKNTVDEVTIEAEQGGRHTPGSWVREGLEHHIRHALEHLYHSKVNDGQAITREDLTHALTRVTMALHAWDNNGLMGDNGPEGLGYDTELVESDLGSKVLLIKEEADGQGS